MHTDPWRSPDAQEWLRKVNRSWLVSHIRDGLKGSRHYNPRVPLPSRPKVALLDTGYDPNASFLAHPHKMRLKGHWKDFWEGQEHPNDDDGHGTSMLSLILEVAPFADIYVARIAGGSKNMQNERERTSDNLAKVSTHFQFKFPSLGKLLPISLSSAEGYLGYQLGCARTQC